MTTEDTKPPEEGAPPPETEWDQRVLCSDESCTGTIGPDGKCRVCAKSYEGEAPIPTGTEDTDSSTEWEALEAMENETTQEDDSSGETHASDPLETTGTDWDDRVLCSDESCVGTMGPDGRCRVCGKQKTSI